VSRPSRRSWLLPRSADPSATRAGPPAAGCSWHPPRRPDRMRVASWIHVTLPKRRPQCRCPDTTTISPYFTGTHETTDSRSAGNAEHRSHRRLPHSVPSSIGGFQNSRSKAAHLVHRGRRAIRGDGFMNVTSHAQGMGNKGSSQYRALQRELERRHRQQRERSSAQPPPPDGAPAEESSRAGTRRAAARTCGWCHRAITPRSRGPIPKWCSATCRHRAWEQARAAASGRSAVEIVERVVTLPATAPLSASRPRQLAWVDLLRQLAVQVEQGTVYDRHLAAIATAVDDVMRAVRRRGSAALRSSPRWPQG
jgi:hypothetical protein